MKFSFFISFLMVFGLASCSERKGTPAPVSFGLSEPVKAFKATPEIAPPLDTEQIIVVQQGETVESLSEQYDISSDEIIKRNNLMAPYFIYPGQNLKLPGNLPKKPIPLQSSRHQISSSSPDLTIHKEDEDVPLLHRPKKKKLSVLEREKELEEKFSTLEREKESSSLLKKKYKESEVETVTSDNHQEALVPSKKPFLNSEKPIAKSNETFLEIPAKKDLKKKKESSLTKETTAPAPTDQVSSASLSFIWPVKGKIISPFSQSKDKTKNDGINIAVEAETPILATQAGRVSYAGNELKGFGNLILIRHSGGWMSVYGHCSQILVKHGQEVQQKKVIAYVGNTGSVSTPQLHFELRKKARAVDPEQYLE